MEKIWHFLSGRGDFPARWGCGKWTQLHGSIHIASDIAIWAAYMAIPLILIYFIRKRKDLPFSSAFWLFGAFIAFCGTTHLIESIIYWVPIYRISAVFKVATAVVSWLTVLALFRIVPLALQLRSPKELQAEIDKRVAVENMLHEKALELQRMNEDLAKKYEIFEEQNKNLNKLNEFMVGRELKIVELKKEIQALKNAA